MDQRFGDIMIMWLDDYIGQPGNNLHLKRAFVTSTDPSVEWPIDLTHRDVDYVLRSSEPLVTLTYFYSDFRLLCLTDPNKCLYNIREYLKGNKQIYLIVSDSLARAILPQIVSECPNALESGSIQIYILIFYQHSVLEWLFDYADYILVFEHEADLLCRLLRDIAQYYVRMGKMLLTDGSLIDSHQALTYFYWAKTLLFRADKLIDIGTLQMNREVENFIDQTEKMLENGNSSSDDELYIGDDLKMNLNNNILIYHSKEHQSQAKELSSILSDLTNEQAVLFDDFEVFITKLKEICSVKYRCPIVIESENTNQMKILTELSSLIRIHQIYIFNPVREHTSITNDHRTLLQKFPKLRDIFFQAKILALDWAFERALLCKTIGELCVRNDDHDLARTYYAKEIELNRNVAAFITKK